MTVILNSFFKFTLKSSHPINHEMDVLEHNPLTVLGRVNKAVFSNLLLTLSHGDVSESSVSGRFSYRSTNSLNNRSGIFTREKYKEDRSFLSGLLVINEEVESGLFNELFSHVFSNKLS